jgi:hypothetical protein
LLYVSFPPYYSLTGGHAISPLHYLPGKLPFKIYKRLYKNKHKSFRYYGLYKTTIQSIKKMSDEMFHIIDIRPRLFTFLKPLLKVPIINEGISHHIEFILKKK